MWVLKHPALTVKLLVAQNKVRLMKTFFGFTFILMSTLLLGCGETAEGLQTGNTELSAESQTLLDDLHGRWRLQHLVIGYCPQSLGKSPFMGESRWETKSGQLKMSAVSQNSSDLVLDVQDGRTLTRHATVEIEGCTISEEITMTLKEMKGRYAQGFYAAHYFHDGSASCTALAQTYEIQESCSVTADWSGLRLSRQP